MLIRELSRTQSLELLQRGHLGRLACALDGQPYVVPVQYSFDPEKRCLYCFSAIGQKIEWMRRNPLVCVEVDEIEDKDHWNSVVVYGRYEEINSDDKDAVARQRAQELFQQRPEWWLPGAAKLPTREPHAVVLYRVQIDRITGRGASRSTLG
jgi:nitroimidazol reductase NimA-like FMN-containing flavoprotein (pyridoxamine 5'-phosphate oxidase superfamily)